MTDKNPDFALQDFLPYLLNQAAEKSSLEFQQYYRGKYGMLRTEWRVLFHLGGYGRMTARDICTHASIHKTKVSRAVKALELKRYVTRSVMKEDRRNEMLDVTRLGMTVFKDLSEAAKKYDAALSEKFTAEDIAVFRSCLMTLADLPSTQTAAGVTIE